MTREGAQSSKTAEQVVGNADEVGEGEVAGMPISGFRGLATYTPKGGSAEDK
uniref:Uncharacterized protein n=1 Tax=Oryza sativa subsp. japonica TaxID=39947 RepID=Q6YWG1_ORYSJ|nr:hypothetical protein [Oryza sativa Japonica Group]BAD10642.1 hypothetical protein [Oryza sativa Japonica Group]